MKKFTQEDIKKFLKTFGMQKLNEFKVISTRMAIKFNSDAATIESWLLFQEFQDWLEKQE